MIAPTLLVGLGGTGSKIVCSGIEVSDCQYKMDQQ